MGQGVRKLVTLLENLQTLIDEADQRIIAEDEDSTHEVDPAI